MRETKPPEDHAETRLASVLPPPARVASPSGAEPIYRARPPLRSEPDAAKLTWAEVVPGWSDAMPGWPHDAPGWPDDVTLPTPTGPHPAGPAPNPPDANDLARHPAWTAVDTPLRPPALPGAGAFDGPARARLSLFDPGRRGVRALVAVAVVVVIVAAFVAWRARPRVDAVPPPLAVAGSVDVTSAAAVPPSSSPRVVVAVGGKVRKPGLVELAAGARVADALQAAGGAQPGVDVAPLNLARKVVDGELIMVGATPPPGSGAAPAGPGVAAPGGLVNLNTATLADLDTLPGVGPVLAQRILDARDAQGGFTAVTDLRKVDGIGTARFEQLKDLVTV